jgi:hypothetical protein
MPHRRLIARLYAGSGDLGLHGALTAGYRLSSTEGWAMRRVLAVASAGLLAFTIVTRTASAADLNPPPIMPVKAPAVVEAPPPDYTWLWIGLGLAAVGVGASCLAGVDGFCRHGTTPPQFITNGGNNSDSSPSG